VWTRFRALKQYVQEKLPMKSNQPIQDTHSRKKALVLKQAPPKRRFRRILLAAVAVAAMAGVYFVAGRPGVNTPVQDEPTGVQNSSTQISYPLSLFEDGRARHFEHKTGDGVPIRYFVLKSTDGVVRAAFDACDVCWPENKGYSQDGHVMVCNNCGRRFESAKINEVQGGCNPAPLKRIVQNDRLILLVQDLEQGQRYFNFEAGGQGNRKGSS
jgi:uncharacterized membrane protein